MISCEECGREFTRKDSLRRHWNRKGHKPVPTVVGVHFLANGEQDLSVSDILSQSQLDYLTSWMEPTQVNTYVDRFFFKIENLE